MIIVKLLISLLLMGSAVGVSALPHQPNTTANASSGTQISALAQSASSACTSDRDCHGDTLSAAARGAAGAPASGDGDDHGALSPTVGMQVSAVAKSAPTACDGDRNCHGAQVSLAAHMASGTVASESDRDDHSGSTANAGGTISALAHSASHDCTGDRDCHGDKVSATAMKAGKK